MAKRDSENKTGQKGIGELSREILLEVVHGDDIKDSINALRDMIKYGENKDRLGAIKILFEYTVAKPKQELDMTTGGEKLSTVSFDIFRNDKDK